MIDNNQKNYFLFFGLNCACVWIINLCKANSRMIRIPFAKKNFVFDLIGFRAFDLGW